MKLTQLTLALGMTALCSTTFASDARSIGMGDTGITTGVGISGVMQNPALLAQQKESGKSGSFRFGVTVGVQDPNNIADDADKFKDVGDRLDTQSKAFDGKTVNAACAQANPAGSTVCTTGVGALRNAAADASNLLGSLDNKPVFVNAGVDLGFTYLKSTYPVAINLRSRAAVNVTSNVAQSDLGYLNSFKKATNTNDLTFQDIQNNPNLSIKNGKLEVAEVDDSLVSQASGYAVVTQELAFGLAKAMQSKPKMYMGLTPRIIRLSASNVTRSVKEKDGEKDISDQFDDNREDKTRLTADIGFLMASPTVSGLSYGLVMNDILPYRAVTKTGETISTNPQLLVSAGLDRKNYTVTADLALNEAKKLGIPTQRLGLGGELKWKYFAVRAGLAHDFAMEEKATSGSVGFDLGFIELGAKFNGNSSAQVGVQTSVAF